MLPNWLNTGQESLTCFGRRAASARPQADGVFIQTPAAVVVLGSVDWNAAAAQAAFTSAFTAVRGKTLVVATSSDLLQSVTTKLSTPAAAQGASYAAGFELAQEL